MKTNLQRILQRVQHTTGQLLMTVTGREPNAAGINSVHNGIIRVENPVSGKGFLKIIGVPSSLAILITAMMISGCSKQPGDSLNGVQLGAPNAHSIQTGKLTGNYVQTNLVSDIAGFNAARIDVTLKNAWGIAINPTGIFWINANGTDNSEVFHASGAIVRPPVSVPTPSGIVFNNTAADFVIPASVKARFIFSSEDGNIYAWASGNTAIKVITGPADAVYKGLELANDGFANFLFATDFHNGKVDVFDKDFNLVTTKSFSDPNIPAGFAPFNIRLLDNVLYVTYAKQLAPDNHDDEAGLGNGFVDVYGLDGSLLKRFASQGMLNSPWGLEKAPGTSGQGDDAILVGNFGDGHINVFKEATGEYLRQLESNGLPVTIDGLWAITFPDGRVPGDDPSKLYFSAGPNGESNGLFGYLMKK